MSNLARKLQEQHREQQQQEPVKVLKKVRAKCSKGEKLLASLLLVVMIVVSAIIVANHASIYALNNEIYMLERSIHDQSEVNAGLELQVIELSAPDRILSIATEKLGMTLDDDKVKVIQN